MVEAYFIYTILFLFTLSLTYITYLYNNKQDYIAIEKKKGIHLILTIVIFFYTLILGLRKDVGYDYASYYGTFKYFKYIGNGDDNDFIFTLFYPSMIQWNIHYNIFIAFLAFILIYTLIYGFKDKISILYIYIFYFFTNLIMLTSVNIMRQYAAYFIMFYAFHFFLNKNYKKFFLWFIIGFSIHRSCIIYLPFLFFVKKDLIPNRLLQYALVIISFIAGAFIFQQIFQGNILDFMSPFLRDSKYTGYTDNHNFEMMNYDPNNAFSTGLYKDFLLCIDFLIIYKSKYLKNKYTKYNLIFFYNLYIIGVISHNIFSFNEITSRIFKYFELYRFYILAILTFDCFQERKNYFLKYSFIIIFILSIIFFYRTISNQVGGCAPWKFI